MDDQQEPRRRGWFGRLVGLAAIAGGVALWQQRQRQRDLDEELWGDPNDLDDPRPPAAPAEAFGEAPDEPGV
jgi:hypothetical protein